MLITLAQIDRAYKRLDAERPHLHFPRRLCRACFLTLTLWFTLGALFCSGIFIIITVFAAFAFGYYYFRFVSIWRLLGMSVWKISIALAIVCAVTATAATLLRTPAAYLILSAVKRIGGLF